MAQHPDLLNDPNARAVRVDAGEFLLDDGVDHGAGFELRPEDYAAGMTARLAWENDQREAKRRARLLGALALFDGARARMRDALLELDAAWSDLRRVEGECDAAAIAQQPRITAGGHVAGEED